MLADAPGGQGQVPMEPPIAMQAVTFSKRAALPE